MQGKAIAIGDVEAQTKHVLELIRHVLIDGGASWANLATLRICYKHSGSTEQSAKLFQQILEIIREVMPEPRPAITAFGADLLYEGLLLEIDGVAIIGSDRKSIASSGIQSSPKGFPEAWRTGSELYFGALGVSDGGSLSTQATACIDKLASLLLAANATPRDLVKLTIFFVATAEDSAGAEGQKTIRQILRTRLPTPGPVITLVQVASLPEQGRLIQVDGVCICDRA
jgi:enamine deaminase RidA (YjgF/YER057c/UK114 family)